MALADNLIAAWELDEASGNAIDSHGSNDLTETSGTIATATGLVYGSVRDFELADTEYFAINDNTDVSTGDIDFTFEAWLQRESEPAFMFTLAQWGAAGNRSYGFGYTGGATDRMQFFVSADGTASVTVNADNHGALDAATWYHVIGWHDSVANEIGIAINAGTPNTTAHSTGVFNSTAQFQIGAGNAGSNWDGLIGPARTWKRVLTSDERTELYNAGAGRDYAYITAPPAGGNRRRRVLICGGQAA